MGSLTPGALAAVIEAVAPFSLVLDEEGRIVHAGPAMSRLVPGARAGSYFKDVFEATRPTDLETFLRPAKGLRFFQDRSRALKFKGSVKHIDGGVHLLAANPLINAEQTIGMLGITFSDLPPHDSIAEYVFLQQSYDTSLLEARQALETARQQEDALRAVIDSSTDQIIVVDMGGRVARWNRTAEAFHGIPEAHALGRTLGGLFLPARYAAVWDRFLARLAQDAQRPAHARPFELTLTNRHGQRVTLEVRMTSFHQGGRFLQINALDLSERLRVESEIRNREAYFRSVITNMDLGLLVVDLEERVLSTNAAMARILGCTEGEMIGRQVHELVKFTDAQEGDRARRRAAEERSKGLSGAWEVSIRHPDTGQRHLLVSGAPRFDPQGELVGSIGIHLDITDRIDMARELERSRNWFQTLVSKLPGAVFLEEVRPQPAVRFISSFVASITGYPPEWYLGGAVQRLQNVHPEDALEVREQVEHAIAHEEDYTMEYRIVRPDSGVVWVREVGRFFHESDRLMLTGNLFDISREHEVQQLVELNERMIEALAPAIAALLEEGDVVENIGVGMKLMGNSLGVDRVTLFRMNGTDTGSLDCGPVLKWSAPDTLDPSEPWRAPMAALGPVGEATLAMRSYTTRRVSEAHGQLRGFMEQEQVERLLSIPLRTRKGVWGFICIDIVRDGFWAPDTQMAALEAFAAAVSEALERDRINVQRQLDLEVEKAISRMAASMLGHATEDSLLEDFVVRMATEFGLEHCIVYRIEDARGCLLPKAAWRDGRIATEFITHGPVVHPGAGIVGDVLRSHRLERIDDTSKDPRYVPDERHRLSELVVPVMFGERLLGIINTEDDRPAFYGPKHERTLATVAAMLSAQLMRLEKKQRWEDELLQKAVLQERLNDELALALNERTDRLRELEAMSRYADSNPSPVLRITHDGLLGYANQASAPVLSALNVHVGERLPPDLFARFRGASGPLIITCGDVIFEMTTAPVPEFNFINVYGTDITAIQRLREAQEELVSQERLSAIGRITAGIAHEINSPLGAVVGSAQNLDLLLRELVGKSMLSILPEDQVLLAELLPELPASLSPAVIMQRSTLFRERLASIAPELNRKHWPVRMAEVGWSPDPGQSWERLVTHPRREQLMEAVVNIASMRESLRTVHFAAERASKVVQALRSYMHRDEKRHVAEFDVARQLRMVATLFSVSGRKGVRLHQRTPEVCMARGVEDELAQVWTNLLSNALHAVGDEGDIEVELLAMHDRFQVSVVNNGPPIPADIMARMYDPMFTTKKKGEGTGLGLSIVKGFVESHQGSITCDSSTERTIFVISLPTNPSPIHDERTSAGHTVGGR